MGENENIVYLPYGLDEISLLDLMASLSDGIESYLGSKKWARKLKYRDAWLNAYQDIMSQGITGATNTSGLWKITHKGNIDIDSKSAIEKEMYGDAAYYIQLKMAGLTPRSKKEEEDKNKKKENYGNFSGRFSKYIIDNNFGGEESLFSDENEGWNALDARGENGLRGNINRKDRVLKALDALKKDLDNNEYDFEGTPYKDKADLIARIQKAEEVLKNDDPNDDSPALNALGFSYGQWFNNGGNDQYTTEGFTGTYNDYYNKYLPGLQKLQELAKRDKLANQYSVNDVFHYGYGMQGLQLTPEELRDYLGFALGVVANPNRSLEDLLKLLGIFLFAARNNGLLNLSKEELEKFGKFVGYRNPTRLKKIPNLEGVYYDAIMRRLVIPKIEGEVADLLTLYNLNNPEVLQQKALKTPRGNGIELTGADYRDISATILDLASMINPEIVTGTATALTASGLRTWNSLEEKGIWDTITDWKNWADWGTSLLGGTPLLGDASSLAKFARGLGKIMTVPAVISAINNVPEARKAWAKIDKNNLVESLKTLTPEDYHAISSVLVGVLAGKNYLKGNLAERKVIEHSGYTPEQINSSKSKVRQYAEKYGVLRTRVPGNKTETPTIKVKVNDKDTEITIDAKTKSKIETEVRKAGNKEAERNKAVEKVLKEEGKIKDADKVTVASPKKYRDMEYSPFKTTKDLFGTTSIETAKGLGDFDEWLTTRSTWNRWRFGTDENLRGIRNRLGLNGTVGSQTLLNSSSSNNSESLTSNLSQNTQKITPEIRKNILKYLKIIEEAKNPKHSRTAIKDGTEGVIHLNGLEIKFLYNGKENSIIINGNKILVDKTKGQAGIRQEVAKFLEETRMKSRKEARTSKTLNKFKVDINEIRKLKRQGLLKQGGTIYLDTTVKEFFKNNNI